MAPKVKLMYFDIRARAEIIRIMLNYGGVEFEDQRIQPFWVEGSDWPIVKQSKVEHAHQNFTSNINCIFQRQSMVSCQS